MGAGGFMGLFNRFKNTLFPTISEVSVLSDANGDSLGYSYFTQIRYEIIFLFLFIYTYYFIFICQEFFFNMAFLNDSTTIFWWVELLRPCWEWNFKADVAGISMQNYWPFIRGSYRKWCYCLMIGNRYLIRKTNWLGLFQEIFNF